MRISGFYQVSLCFFIIYLIFSTANCISVDHFLDGFNEGVDPLFWKIEGSWCPDSGERFEGPQSIISDLICQENATISSNKTFSGPCKISFLWKISEGHNKLTFYDNNCLTPYRLPSFRFGGEGHGPVNWTEVTINLSDRNEHRLKWVHENPYDRGRAWLDKVQIDYCIPPKFENYSVSPREVICMSDSVSDVNSDSAISSKFNYSVESSSNNLTLYVVPPNSSDILGPFYPNNKTQSHKGLNRFEWDNIKLNCRDIGNGSYWFASEDGYLSPKKDDPYVTTFIYDTSSEVYNISENSHENRYYIMLKSTKNWNIIIKLPNGNNLDGTESYSANTGLQSIPWDYLWDDTMPIPSPLSFYLS